MNAAQVFRSYHSSCRPPPTMTLRIFLGAQNVICMMRCNNIFVASLYLNDFYFNRTREEIFSHLLRRTFWFLLLSSVLFYFLQVFYFSIWDTFFSIFLHIFIQNTKKKKTENLLPHTLLTVVCQKYFLVLNNLKHDTHNCHRICLYIYGCFWNH